jgi:DNA processing protein
MNAEEARLCLLLHSISGLEDSTLAQILVRSGSPQALAEGGAPLWRELGLSSSVSRSLAQTLCSGSPVIDIGAQLAKLCEVGADIIAITDTRYPPLLKGIHDPPPLLYVRGDPALLSQAQLAMVGSRKASPAGLRAAGEFAGLATRAGLHITSGLALGIDAASHQGALAVGGSSVAVVATGIDRVYPARHRSLAQALEEGGCLVSEFPLGLPPVRSNFPRRNRIVSGLSLGVLVVEAALPSGSLITARTALDQGREVFTLPWSIYHAGGAGCLYLIRDGAKMVAAIEDILEELGPMYALQQDLLQPEAPAPAPAEPELSGSEQTMLQLVGYERVTADELSQLSALPVARVMAELSSLELLGVIARECGGYIRN